MKNFTKHLYLAIALFVGFAVVSQASARSFRHGNLSPIEYKMVKVEAPTFTDAALGTFYAAAPTFSGYMRVPILPTIVLPLLRDGGNDDGDDTTDDNDTSDDHHGDNDTTDNDHHDGDHDTTDNDHHGGGHDTTDVSDSTDDGHDMNDTLECHGHHDHGDNDSNDVNDTTSRAMFSGGHQSIVIKSHGQNAGVAFTFTNNLKTSVTLTGMSFITGKNFRVTSGAPTYANPVTLKAGQKISIKVSFTSTDNAVHTDQLQIQSNSAQAQSVITLTGIQTAASVSTTLPVGVSITMGPNPMTSRLVVDLTGVRDATIGIFDLTGKQVASANAVMRWVWNAQSSDGTYFVRISGTSDDGTSFATSRKVIIQH